MVESRTSIGPGSLGTVSSGMKRYPVPCEPSGRHSVPSILPMPAVEVIAVAAWRVVGAGRVWTVRQLAVSPRATVKSVSMATAARAGCISGQIYFCSFSAASECLSPRSAGQTMSSPSPPSSYSIKVRTPHPALHPPRAPHLRAVCAFPHV